MVVSSMTYAASGVDIDAGTRFVGMIGERIKTAWPQDNISMRGFSGRTALPKSTDSIAACSDGSGTMAILAALTERFNVIGRNAAAMSLVDCYVSGNLPVDLQDMIDVGRLRPEKHIEVIDGLIEACQGAGNCRLSGGETAELPDMFAYDWMVNINTSVVGVPDDTILSGPVQPGQTVWGWRSDGPGSNGFSLIRNVFDLKRCYSWIDELFMLVGWKRSPKRALKILNQYVPDCGETLADALLKPVPVWINQIENQRYQGVMFAAHAHITGGGLVDNIPRVLPENCKVVLDRSTWKRPPIFRVIERQGRISEREMDRTFNQGIMVISILNPAGREPNTPNIFPVGEVVHRRNGEPQVELIGTFS